MATKPSELATRIREVPGLHGLGDIAARLDQNVNRVATVVQDDVPGPLRDQIVAALDEWERNGLPPLPPERYVAIREQQMADNSREGQERAARERQDRHNAILAELAEQEAAARQRIAAELREAAVRRVEVGAELVALREASGLTQAELGALAQMDASVLSRMEHGAPVGRGITETVLATYRAAAKLAGPAAAKATKAAGPRR
jgi:hypothetical protein